MPEATPIDVFIDDFQLELGPHGAVIVCKTTMGLKEPMTHARLRMSIEHMKLLTFRMHALVRQVERDQQVKYPMIAFWRT